MSLVGWLVGWRGERKKECVLKEEREEEQVVLLIDCHMIPCYDDARHKTLGNETKKKK